MTVSLVVPTLNEEHHLPTMLRDITAAIDACADHRFEVLVVDSNSDDGTRDIAREHPTVDALHTAGPGILTARHEGFKRAEGAIVVSLDADTRYPRTFLERLLAPFDADDDVVLTYGPAYGEKSLHVDAWIRLGLQFGLKPVGIHWVSGANRAVDREAYFDVGGFNLDRDGNSLRRVMFEEQVWFPRRLARTGRIVFEPAATAFQSARTLEELLLLDRKQGGRHWNLLAYGRVKPALKSGLRRAMAPLRRS